MTVARISPAIRDRSAVHMYDYRKDSLSAIQFTACHRRVRDCEYVVLQREFGVLTTPPAPWCFACELHLHDPEPA